MLVVNPFHWLNPDGSLPTDNLRLRRQVLRIARLIEYGGPLGVNETRETLIECAKRPGGKPCLGLLWVAKTDPATLHAHCAVCHGDDVVIHGWEETAWADGMMEAVKTVAASGDRPS